MVRTAFRGSHSLATATVIESVASAQISVGIPEFYQPERLNPLILFDDDPNLPELSNSEAQSWMLEPTDESRGFHEAQVPDDQVGGEDPQLASVPADFSLASGNGHSAGVARLGPEVVYEPTRHDYDRDYDQDYEQVNEETRDHFAVSTEPEMDSNPTNEEDDEAAAPSDEPAHAADYSRGQWPVLIGPTRRSSFLGLRTSLVILTLLGCAAVFYFLIYAPSTVFRKGSTPTNASARGQESADAGSPDHRSESALGDQSQIPVSSSEPTASSDPKSGTQAATEDASNPNGRGRFSLQAAAFPNQSGADEFAEKLRRAGVPSYVASADMGRRGTWFRVRVGRFETAENAKQYSGEAQLRAKGAGISLQLIVCQYEQQ